ncbi:hypothetical protein MRB53_000879 [Persea americana]|uniref:Uncharacterized protein n=1 Tax=Persea americana TaxID=3435 RepID=A0ACC2MR10_PERAE|nr:hypothetical protein MRB53_000879 [Persea americana]
MENPLLSIGSDIGSFDHNFVIIQNGGRFFAMRHGRRVPKLNRPPDQRRALLRCLTTQLLKHGRILTTKARARAMRKLSMPCLQKFKTDMGIGMEGIQESSGLCQGEGTVHPWLTLSLSRVVF